MSKRATIRTLIACSAVRFNVIPVLAAIAVLAVLIPVGTETQGGSKNGPLSPPTGVQAQIH